MSQKLATNSSYSDSSNVRGMLQRDDDGQRPEDEMSDAAGLLLRRSGNRRIFTVLWS